MKNKIIKPGLLLAACFVMQMTGATAASLSAAVAVDGIAHTPRVRSNVHHTHGAAV